MQQLQKEKTVTFTPTSSACSGADRLPFVRPQRRQKALVVTTNCIYTDTVGNRCLGRLALHVMVPFRDLDIPPVLDTSTRDLTRDFFAPLLSNAVRYDRGVGFFSSGWLRINAVGMATVAARGGYARWITSPILSK